MISVALVNHPVDYAPLKDLPDGAGGECVFLGRTRRDRHSKHGGLVRLSYEAYVPMAEQVLRELAQQAVSEFGCLAVRVVHALGEVPVGAASVMVQVACGHRGEAFEACRFLIDRLKTEAPIWKREVWEDGTTWSAGNVVDAERVST